MRDEVGRQYRHSSNDCAHLFLRRCCSRHFAQTQPCARSENQDCRIPHRCVVRRHRNIRCVLRGRSAGSRPPAVPSRSVLPARLQSLRDSRWHQSLAHSRRDRTKCGRRRVYRVHTRPDPDQCANGQTVPTKSGRDLRQRLATIALD